MSQLYIEVPVVECSLDAMLDDDGFEPASDEPGPLDCLLDKELKANLHEALSRLTPRQAEAIALCFFQGQTHDRAAATMGIGRSAVSHLVARGVASLRVDLAGLGLAP